MSYISFSWSEQTRLAVELTRPIKMISASIVYGMPSVLTLWRSDGTGIRIKSRMHDVAERIEIGVLDFSLVMKPSSGETTLDMGFDLDQGLSVSKLLINESGTTVESGVALSAAEDIEIIIVPRDYPCFLAIRGLPITPDIFNPEYPLDQYKRIPMDDLEAEGRRDVTK
jgi:hypothetical protein